MPKGSDILLILLISASFIIAYNEATIDHPSPKGDLKKRKAVSPSPPPKVYVARFDSEQNQYLNMHNTMRQLVGVSPLAWDANLAASAHAWALQRQGDCKYRVHSPNKYGENIYWMNYKEFTPSDVVKKWFDESKFYNHEKNECMCMPERDGCECGHYLNLIWSSTKRVGCSGAVYCDNQKGVLVVCQYDPAGLIPGINPFTGQKIVGGAKGGNRATSAVQSTSTKAVQSKILSLNAVQSEFNLTGQITVSGGEDGNMSTNVVQAEVNVTIHS